MPFWIKNDVQSSKIKKAQDSHSPGNNSEIFWREADHIETRIHPDRD
jgi:hypothetical protein